MAEESQSKGWSDIAAIMHSLVVIYRDQEKTHIPSFHSMPSPEVEYDCDEWCRRLSTNPTELLHPPEQTRSWMLVRLTCAYGRAKALARGDHNAPAEITPRLIERLLVDEWHGSLKQTWQSLSDFAND